MAKRKTNNSNSQRRRRSSKTRPQRRLVWIVVEGATEYNYLVGLKNLRMERGRFAVKLFNQGGRTRKGIVERAIRERQQASWDPKQDLIVCVMDTEDKTHTKQADLADAIRLAEEEGIPLVLSNPCVEVWLLCHFDDFKPRKFHDTDAAIDALEKQWCSVCKDGYQKSDPKMFDRIGDRLDVAITKATYLRENFHKDKEHTRDANASTDIYRLVELLLKQRSKYEPFKGNPPT